MITVTSQGGPPKDAPRVYTTDTAQHWQAMRQQGLFPAIQQSVAGDIATLKNVGRFVTGQTTQGPVPAEMQLMRDMRNHGPKQALVRHFKGELNAVTNDVNALVGNPFESVSFASPTGQA